MPGGEAPGAGCGVGTPPGSPKGSPPAPRAAAGHLRAERPAAGSRARLLPPAAPGRPPQEGRGRERAALSRQEPGGGSVAAWGGVDMRPPEPGWTGRPRGPLWTSPGQVSPGVPGYKSAFFRFVHIPLVVY